MQSSYPILLAGALLLAITGNSQTDILPSTILDFPDIHPDSLWKYRTLHEAFRAFDEGLVETMPELSAHEEIRSYLPPNFTEPYGCSWYCADPPRTFRASSALAANGKNNYQAHLVHDFDLETAWVEGEDGHGIGSVLEISVAMQSPLNIHTITIYNGYCKSLDVWRKNSRVKRLKVHANGQSLGTFVLEDTYFGQAFSIPPQYSSEGGMLELRFEILEVYPGTHYADTAISEINFDGGGHH